MGKSTFQIKSGSKTELIDITGKVSTLLQDSGMKEGVVVVYVPHTTAGITINESADPAVRKDILMELNKVIPFQDGYTHMEGNSAAHIKTLLTGNSVVIPVENGNLMLGTWQAIYFCEYDGSRNRKVIVSFQPA